MEFPDKGPCPQGPPSGIKGNSDHKPKAQLLALQEGYGWPVDLCFQEFSRFQPPTGVWNGGKLWGMEKVGGAVGLLFENGLEEAMQAGDPKQQNGWAATPDAS